MTGFVLQAAPLSAEAFAPYGDVIESAGADAAAMNAARFRRSRDLAAIDIDPVNGGHVALSIAETLTPVAMPYSFDLMERHPLASQAFIPLGDVCFTVVVAPAHERIDLSDLAAFTTNGRQGVNYRRGIWHMPLISASTTDRYLIVDRAPGTDNYEELLLPETVLLKAS